MMWTRSATVMATVVRTPAVVENASRVCELLLLPPLLAFKPLSHPFRYASGLKQSHECETFPQFTMYTSVLCSLRGGHRVHCYQPIHLIEEQDK